MNLFPSTFTHASPDEPDEHDAVSMQEMKAITMAVDIYLFPGKKRGTLQIGSSYSGYLPPLISSASVELPWKSTTSSSAPMMLQLMTPVPAPMEKM